MGSKSEKPNVNSTTREIRTWSYSQPMDFLIALLLFLPTLFFVPHALFLAPLILLILKDQKLPFEGRDWLLLLFVIGAYLNVLLHHSDFVLTRHLSSLGVMLVFLTAIASKKLSRRISLWLVFFVCLEVFVGVYEYLQGSVALFSSQLTADGGSLYINSDRWYDLRVYGLSANSSGLAQKLFLALLLLYFVDANALIKRVFLVLIIIGLFITFNRTAIIASSIFLLLYSLRATHVGRVKKSHLAVIFVVIAIAIVSFWDAMLFQFTRGLGGLSYSELTRIFYALTSLQFILDNPLLGNGSLTYKIWDGVVMNYSHAHNSLIMLFSTHGLLLAPLLLGYLILGNWKQNIVYLIPLALFSLTQYLFFWNVSLADLVLFRFFYRDRASYKEVDDSN